MSWVTPASAKLRARVKKALTDLSLGSTSLGASLAATFFWNLQGATARHVQEHKGWRLGKEQEQAHAVPHCRPTPTLLMCQPANPEQNMHAEVVRMLGKAQEKCTHKAALPIDAADIITR
jgi:hypothetical protein